MTKYLGRKVYLKKVNKILSKLDELYIPPEYKKKVFNKRKATRKDLKRGYKILDPIYETFKNIKYMDRFASGVDDRIRKEYKDAMNEVISETNGRWIMDNGRRVSRVNNRISINMNSANLDEMIDELARLREYKDRIEQQQEQQKERRREAAKLRYRNKKNESEISKYVKKVAKKNRYIAITEIERRRNEREMINLASLIGELKEANSLREEARTLRDFRRELNELRNGNSDRIVINERDEAKFNTLLREVGQEGPLVLRVVGEGGGDVYYTLNNNTINRLTSALGGLLDLSEAGTVSDQELVNEMRNGASTVELMRPLYSGGAINFSGSSFDYICKIGLDLSRYQIATKHEQLLEDNYIENCFVHCLRLSGIDKVICDKIEMNLMVKSLERKKISSICEKYGFRVKVRCNEGDKNAVKYGTEGPEIEIGLILNHYFLIEKTNYSREYIKDALETLKSMEKEVNEIDEEINPEFLFGKQEIKPKGGKSRDYMNSYLLIKFLSDNKDYCLIPQKFENDVEIKRINRNRFDTLLKSSDLEYSEMCVIPSIKYGVKVKDFDYVNVEFDTETTTDGLMHKSYLLRTYEKGPIQTRYLGRRGGLEMLKYLSTKYTYVKLIAHNLKYDYNFIVDYLVNYQFIEKNGKKICGNGLFIYYKNGKKVKNLYLKFQDSYSLIPKPLRDFSRCFGLNQTKEYMPYNMYTEANVSKRYIHIDKFREYNKFDEFEKNCNAWKCINGKEVDIINYSSEYCRIDCEVLHNGYETFRRNIKEITGDEKDNYATGLDIDDYATLPSIADAYFRKKGVYEGVCRLNGLPREYIQQFVVGGRTMVKMNENNYVLADLSDCDANNLYPSAMLRLGGYLPGEPQVLQDDQKNYEFLQTKCTGYFVDVLIKSVSREYKFPLLSNINDKGTRIFNNEIVGKIYHLDKISLEDAIKFQGITFDIIKGYYYVGERNNKLREVIMHLFEARRKAKAEGNPIQEVIKLIMNSAYGRSLLKPIEYDIKYISGKRALAYIGKNIERIHSYIVMKNGKMYRIKEYKTIDEHYNEVHCGVEVLSMSKRIMNEVMTLAEDLEIEIEYQDTDSMHIDSNKVNMLSEKYKELYGRDLMGKELGQFHCDFQSNILDANVRQIISTESYFLGKKCYIDKLQGINVDPKKLNKFELDDYEEYNNKMKGIVGIGGEIGEIGIDYHIRMKGVPTESIIYKAVTEYNGDIMQIYKDLNEGKVLTFDLTCGGSRMRCKFNNNSSITSVKVFFRKVSFPKKKIL